MNNILKAMERIAENQGITISKLENQIGASKGVLSRAISNNSDIQSKWLVKLVENYPQYNTNWLLTGEGEMLKNNVPIAARSESDIGIPLIPVEAMAGLARGDVSVMELDCERYVIPMFHNADFLIPVRGSSMVPKYNSGDVVACKRLPLTDLFFQWNKVYVIDTDQGALVKRVARSEEPECIRIVSENPSYEPFDLKLSSIHALSIVVGVVRLE